MTVNPAQRGRATKCGRYAHDLSFEDTIKRFTLDRMTQRMDDYTKLKQTEHMLQWFADEPYAAMRSSVEDMLKEQAPDSRLTTFSVLSDPQWLTRPRHPCEAVSASVTALS
jgi:hypothetical protein